jgi:hypothetical protein
MRHLTKKPFKPGHKIFETRLFLRDSTTVASLGKKEHYETRVMSASGGVWYRVETERDMTGWELPPWRKCHFTM